MHTKQEAEELAAIIRRDIAVHDLMFVSVVRVTDNPVNVLDLFGWTVELRETRNRSTTILHVWSAQHWYTEIKPELLAWVGGVKDGSQLPVISEEAVSEMDGGAYGL